MSWPKNVTLLPVLPAMPNYVEFERPAGWDPSEGDENSKVPVYQLDEAQARGYAEMLKERFMRHWREAVKGRLK